MCRFSRDCGRRLRSRVATAALLCVVLVSSALADVTAEQVKRALDIGVRALEKRQLRDGKWVEQPGDRPGPALSLSFAHRNSL